MNKWSKVSLIIGAVVLIASITVFVIIHPVIAPSTILGLCFLLYSEVVLFGGFVLVDMLSARASKLLLWSGVGTSIGIYGAIVFISSLIFMVTKTAHVQTFLVLQIILLVIVLAICLIVGNFSVNVKEKDNKVLRAGASLQYILDQLMLIKERTIRKADIDRLTEAISYADTSVAVDADVEIADAIARLEEIVNTDDFDSEGFDKTVQNIEFLIKKRTLQARAAKQGSI